ncbi:MAG: protein-arginine deiminase [Archangiaceae bacterium]|nr:protein-arginine deiminase [Archangiaceae bacterium]
MVDLRADVNRDGIVELDNATDDADEETWDAQHGAVFLANIDDDLQRCPGTGTDQTLPLCNDASDDQLNGPDDLLDLAPLKTAGWANAGDGVTGGISVTPAGHVRIFKKTGADVAMFDEAMRLTTDEVRAGVELYLEGKDIVRDSESWDGYVNVTLSIYGAGATLTDTVRMRVSPVMTFHHLTPAETSYVTRVTRDSWSSSFVSSLRTLLNATPEASPLTEIPGNDIWAQDFFETGYMAMPAPNGQQHVIRTAYRSAGIETNGSSPLRAAGQIVFTKFRGKDSAGLQAYTTQQNPDSVSLNSYGNTETIPPFKLGDVDYPLGRLLRGDIPSFAPDPVLAKVFESQKVQPHVYIDTSWLLVGHVDETISFLKAPNARGWVLLINDAAMARKMLEDQVAAGNGNVQMFIGKNWYNDRTGAPYSATKTISQVLADTDVMARSAAAVAEIDAQLQIIKAATGLTEAEIIRVPFLHFTAYGYSIAYQPGFVNGFAAGLTDFVAPDPFGPKIGGVDIFKKDFEDKLTAIGYHARWIDDWDLYHTAEGEVHCGTNAARVIPSAKWWEGGR